MNGSSIGNSTQSNKRVRTITGWDLYFPGIDYSPEDPRVVLAEAFRGTLQNKLTLQPEELENNRSVPFNFLELRDTLPQKLSCLFEDDPETALPCLGLALYQNVFENWECNRSQSKPFRRYSLPKVIPRLFNVDNVTPLRSLKSNYIGKFVAIRGTVVRVGNVKPLAISMSFKCSRCSSSVHVFFKDGKYKQPSSCPTPNCRSKAFLPDLCSAVTIDWQKIRMQEQIDKKEPGRVPRTIECELTEDLVDSCVPGDVVTICGVVKVVSTEVDKGKHYDKNKSLFLIYIDANSIDNNKQIDNGKMELMQFTTKEMYAIQEISDERNIFRLIVNSICPGIYGHEMVKAGLALSLFGGCQKFGSHPNKLPIRGDPHMLIVGDPGLGKSQMLTAINNVAPRGVYVCGSYSSTTGLTVSLLKESGSGDYALEAGALVLGDQGCCCIDEFDKMGNEHQALMEAMEQQSVSIAKAGIVCNLPARTSVIAAANPVGGHYNRAKTVCENLKMSQALLSRFDLIFILLDKPDEEKDQLLSEHVMALHGGNSSHNAKLSTPLLKNLSQRDSTLMDKLRIDNPQSFEPIHPLLLRKYIGYARKYVHPTLTPEAAQVIQKFYLSLREKHRSADSTPITTRQLESLIRLSEARAKLELREEVSEEDAQDVIEIMKESLFQRFEDEFGNIDFRRNSGMSKSKEVGRFVQHLNKIAEQTYNSIFTAQQLKEIAREMKLQISISIEDFIDNLNTQGFLLKKGPGYKLQTVSSEFGVRNS